jgi:hypothetical protein
MLGPELPPRAHRFHVNPLLKDAEDLGQGAQGVAADRKLTQ